MKAYKRLFVVFMMAFALALAGGIALSSQAGAACCSCSQSFQSRQPAYSGPLYSRDGRLVPSATYWHQFYNG